MSSKFREIVAFENTNSVIFVEMNHSFWKMWEVFLWKIHNKPSFMIKKTKDIGKSYAFCVLCFSDSKAQRKGHRMNKPNP